MGRCSSIRKGCACVADRVIVEERSGFGLATVMARKGVASTAIGAALGVDLRDGPYCLAGDGIVLLGTGPGSWLAHIDAAPADWAAGLRERLGPLASVSDQSGGYVIFRLSGPGARTVLQRGAAIDFHPAAFAAGAVAATVIAHIGVVIRQIDDAPTYDIALYRSFAGSFRHWLDATAEGL